MKKEQITDNTEKKQRAGMERRLANLKPFKPGQSGNPKGKPKGSTSIISAIKRKLLETPPNEKRNYLEILTTKILKKALVDGSGPMIKLIWNYVDGLPTQTVRGEGLQPIIQLMCTGKEKDLKFPEVKE